MHSPVTFINRSQNSKLSTDYKVNATYASQHTCPDSCPLRGSGCYAELGHPGYTTNRLNKAEEKNPVKIAAIEAELIKASDAEYPLRLHVVGDCKFKKSAELLAEACRVYSSKHGKKAWTYTQNRTIPRKSWGDISILRSCTTIRQAETAIKAGFGAALIVDEFKKDTIYPIGRNMRGIPCPKQTKRSESCVDCKLCMEDKALNRLGIAVLFKAHGTGRKHVLEVLGE